MYMRHIRPTNPTVTADDFRRYISEFRPDDYTDEILEQWIEVARDIYNWGKLGLIYLTAHMIALAVSERADPNKPATPSNINNEQLTRIEAGPMAKYFAQRQKTGNDNPGTGNALFYDRTAYGRTFLELRRATTGIGMSLRVYG